MTAKRVAKAPLNAAWQKALRPRVSLTRDVSADGVYVKKGQTGRGGSMGIAAIVNVVAGLATVGGFITAIWVYWRQTNVQVFLEFTKRYEEIWSALPLDARDARTQSRAALPRESQELRFQVLKYLNLCSEEYYLVKQRYLSRAIWRIWESELARTIQTPLLRREWRVLREEFASYPAFQGFVDSTQNASQ